MTAEPFHHGEIPAFLALADEEGWVVDAWEIEFLLMAFPAGCRVVRENGRAVAFVTALPHRRSGWIGNLLVAPEQRGKGFGTLLFTSVWEALRDAGVQTVWLTASAAGAPLYSRLGFRQIDTIIRWSGITPATPAKPGTAIAATLSTAAFRYDTHCWGDQRQQLLEATVRRGWCLEHADGFIICQPGRAGWQLGAFCAATATSASALFHQSITTLPSNNRFFLDVPAANNGAGRLLEQAGLQQSGSNLLMYAGELPAYHPESLFGLATMGSCG